MTCLTTVKYFDLYLIFILTGRCELWTWSLFEDRLVSIILYSVKLIRRQKTSSGGYHVLKQHYIVKCRFWRPRVQSSGRFDAKTKDKLATAFILGNEHSWREGCINRLHHDQKCKNEKFHLFKPRMNLFQHTGSFLYNNISRINYLPTFNMSGNMSIAPFSLGYSDTVMDWFKQSSTVT